MKRAENNIYLHNTSNFLESAPKAWSNKAPAYFMSFKLMMRLTYSLLTDSRLLDLEPL